MRSTEAAKLAAFLPIFPLVFAASTFTSPKTMPSWLRAFADNQPITQVGRLDPRAHAGCRPGDGPTLRSLAWSVGIGVVCLIASVRRFRKA